MPATDPAVQLARELADLRRRLAAVERGSQGAYRSLVVDGESVTLPQVVRTGRVASETATVAFQAANGKNAVTFSPTDPDHDGVTEGDVWFRRDSSGVITGSWEWDGTTWAEHSFGDEVLNSLTVGKLVTGEMAVGQRIIFGPAEGTHAEGSSTGFRVFREDPVDGIPDEVARMGTTLPDGTPTNDYFAILSADGTLAASIDDSGSVNARTANFREDITVGGKTLTSIVTEERKHSHGYGAQGGLSGLISEIGLVEMVADVRAGRMYQIIMDVNWSRVGSAAELMLRVRNGGTDAPTINSPLIFQKQTSGSLNDGYGQSFQNSTMWSPPADGRYRLLLTAANTGPSGSINIASGAGVDPTLTVLDHGPTPKITGSVNRGGGSTAPPLQQYDTGEMAPAGWISYRGDSSQRTDISDRIVQGWDPSGYNGNGYGYMTWNMPSITGTVDRVDLYLYSEHWYYNSGGTAVINAATGYGPGFTKLADDWLVGGFPKPGGRWVTLPNGWWPYFRNAASPRVVGISLGRGVGTDLAYYGRFIASASRLRIWYTQ